MRSVLQSDPNGNVINLSDYSFTKVHYKYINKNLNFYPIPGYYKKKVKKSNVKNFTKKIQEEIFMKIMKIIKLKKQLLNS